MVKRLLQTLGTVLLLLPTTALLQTSAVAPTTTTAAAPATASEPAPETHLLVGAAKAPITPRPEDYGATWET
ncbi:MAG TPA: hypothetical protein VGD51_10040, partial [Nocardioidaceae bacterium]